MNTNPPHNDEEMNEIPRRKAEIEIGEGGCSGLRRLKIFMGDDFQDSCRFAQSIITRSEVALFGLSIPRFALRFYLENGGFINCRRLATLANMFEVDNNSEWGERYQNLTAKEKNEDLDPSTIDHVSIHELMKNENCIADSLLRQPKSFGWKNFQNLRYVDASTAKLPQAYGEPHHGNSQPPLLPFTQTMNLGGGLCAQAVSFMATAILAGHAKCIHGVAEITALAHDPECRELSLGSLDPQRMARYFEQVNLNLQEQCTSPEPNAILDSSERAAFGSAIRCYLNSGMPVILPTSTRKLAYNPDGESIYDQNRIIIKEDSVRDEDHVVIIIGSALRPSAKTNAPQECLIFNDPGTMPYLVATVDELSSVGVTRKSLPPVSDNGVVMSVVPGPVKMPLLWQRISEQKENGKFRFTGALLGLMDMATEYHQLDGESFGDRFQLICSQNPNPEFPLIQEKKSKTKLESGLLHAISEFRNEFNWKEPHWLWLERFDSSVWIWDAERLPLQMPSTANELAERVNNDRYLLGAVQLDDSENGFTFYSTSGPQT